MTVHSGRFATIDVGTNTAQLLVVETSPAGLRRVHVAERFVRLGEGVDASGRIGAAAQERLLDALRDHRDAARHHGAARIVAAGTSALRDAANRTSVVDRVARELDFSIEILSGDEEATWSFAAACAPFDDLTGPCLVVDVGGGSTELVTGEPSSGDTASDTASDTAPPRVAMTGRVSVDAGCIRLTERHFPTLPPPPEAVSDAASAIDAALDAGIRRAGLTVSPEALLIGTAGTATALARVHAGPTGSFDALRGRVDGGIPALSASDVRAWRERVLTLDVDGVRALHPDAMRGRADVFPAGVMLLDRVMARFNLDTLRVSPYELRHGLALRAAASLSREDAPEDAPGGLR